MTLDEAVTKTIEQCNGALQAVKVASQNGGKPIFLPDGRPVNVKTPSLGDLLLVLIQAQSVSLQLENFIAAALQGGFKLADEEAGRIADLVLERIKKAA